jgi:hypothetical protein
MERSWGSSQTGRGCSYSRRGLRLLLIWAVVGAATFAVAPFAGASVRGAAGPRARHALGLLKARQARPSAAAIARVRAAAASLPASIDLTANAMPVGNQGQVGSSAGVGSMLTATSGSWNPVAASYAYQWERAAVGSNAWAVITGATGVSYTPVSADVNYNVRVLVTASNSAGQGAAFSAGIGPITGGGGAPANTAPPTISGSPAQGQRLTTSVGTWNPAGSSYAYQWQRSGSVAGAWTNISGATTSSYTTGSADLLASHP